MKKLILLILLISLALMLCSGCATQTYDITATTLPVWEFTAALCHGTPVQVGRLISESVSCLHDYTLQVGQMRMLESSQAIVISGLGLEDFLDDALPENAQIIDASHGISPICPEEEENEAHHHDHHHESDPHIWLSPALASVMAENICQGLEAAYPQYSDTFRENLITLQADLAKLEAFGKTSLADLSKRDLITFHDGFSYFAQCFDLTIVKAVEEESGREASAAQLKELILLTQEHGLPAVFTETNGSTSAAQVIAAETGCGIYNLDMAMSGTSYFDAMYHNIQTVKEALK